jgi:hypothetical protein
VLLVILAALAAPRCRVVTRRRWEAGSEGSKGSVPPAGSGCRRPQLPQGIQTPSPCIPWKRRNVVLLGASPANQCLQRAPKKLLVALGPARST